MPSDLLNRVLLLISAANPDADVVRAEGGLVGVAIRIPRGVVEDIVSEKPFAREENVSRRAFETPGW